jgi:hypothetical protein
VKDLLLNVGSGGGAAAPAASGAATGGAGAAAEEAPKEEEKKEEGKNTTPATNVVDSNLNQKKRSQTKTWALVSSISFFLQRVLHARRRGYANSEARWQNSALACE